MAVIALGVVRVIKDCEGVVLGVLSAGGLCEVEVGGDVALVRCNLYEIAVRIDGVEYLEVRRSALVPITHYDGTRILPLRVYNRTRCRV